MAASSQLHASATWNLLTMVDCVWNVMAQAQKPDFVFRRNGRVHLNRQGASAQSTIGSRGVRISGSNAGYNIFRGSVKCTGYPIHSPVSPSLPLPRVTVYHHVSTGLYSLFNGLAQFTVRAYDNFKFKSLDSSVHVAVPVTDKAFITCWDEIFIFSWYDCSCFQPLCQSYLHFATFFKYVTSRILLQLWKHMIITRNISKTLRKSV